MAYIIGIVAILLIAAAALAVAVAKRQSRHRFACPNCGKAFQVRWTQLVFEVHALDEHRLTCPSCGIKDFCRDQGVKA